MDARLSDHRWLQLHDKCLRVRVECMCMIQSSPPQIAHRPKPHTPHTLHLVDRDAVLVAHLVKLVDAHHASVCQHHGASLEPLLAGVVVVRDGRGEPDARGAAPSGRHRVWRNVHRRAQHLRLGDARVANEQAVDVAAEVGAVG
eukprot:244760-Chlamydomonas_euryale.AAC.4